MRKLLLVTCILLALSACAENKITDIGIVIPQNVKFEDLKSQVEDEVLQDLAILGAIYFHGHDDVEKDYVKAKDTWARAAHLGDKDSQYAVGYMFYYGLGVPENRVNSYVWLSLAGTQGDEKAISALKILSERMTQNEIVDAQLASQEKHKEISENVSYRNSPEPVKKSQPEYSPPSNTQNNSTIEEATKKIYHYNIQIINLMDKELSRLMESKVMFYNMSYDDRLRSSGLMYLEPAISNMTSLINQFQRYNNIYFERGASVGWTEAEMLEANKIIDAYELLASDFSVFLRNSMNEIQKGL